MSSTAVLRVRYNGEILEIPALVGKNAYQYAVEGGFTGTQEEFSQLLVSISDKVDAEAFQAHNTDEKAHQDIRDILTSVSSIIEIKNSQDLLNLVDSSDQKNFYGVMVSGQNIILENEDTGINVVLPQNSYGVLVRNHHSVLNLITETGKLFSAMYDCGNCVWNVNGVKSDYLSPIAVNSEEEILQLSYLGSATIYFGQQIQITDSDSHSFTIPQNSKGVLCGEQVNSEEFTLIVVDDSSNVHGCSYHGGEWHIQQFGPISKGMECTVVNSEAELSQLTNSYQVTGINFGISSEVEDGVEIGNGKVPQYSKGVIISHGKDQDKAFIVASPDGKLYWSYKSINGDWATPWSMTGTR